MPNSITGSSNIWPYYAATNTSEAKQREGTSLGSDDFLKILVAQLQHQDPLQPMEDKEFIAQMAQFSAMEEMSKMSKEVQLLRQSMGISSDLIGKGVSWLQESSPDQAAVIHSGIVHSLLLESGLQYVLVGNDKVAIDRLVQVWEPEEGQSQVTTTEQTEASALQQGGE